MNPGIYDGISNDAYHADPAPRPSLSATIATILCQASPAHAYAAHPRLNPAFVPTFEQKYDVGTAAHALLLEGRNAVGVVDADSWRTNDAKAVRDAYREEGKVPLLGKDWGAVQAMCASVEKQLASFEVEPALLNSGKAEQTLIWDQDGVLCRSRVDWLRDDHAAVDDLKTTSRSANPDKFSRTLYDLGYHIKAEFYCRGLEKLTGRRPEFRFLCVETAPPFALSVLSLTPAGWALASSQVDYALDLWERCLSRDEWPGYSTKVAYADPPGWAESVWLEREAREELAA